MAASFHRPMGNNSSRESVNSTVKQNIFSRYFVDGRNHAVAIEKRQVLTFLEKSSSAAGRTRRRLGNTNTCPYVRFDI